MVISVTVTDNVNHTAHLTVSVCHVHELHFWDAGESAYHPFVIEPRLFISWLAVWLSSNSWSVRAKLLYAGTGYYWDG